MNIREWISALPSRSLRFGISMLATTTGVAYGGAVLLVDAVESPEGVAAASLAAGLCLVSAVVALVIGRMLPDPRIAATAMLLSMGVRTGIPLVAAMVVRLRFWGLVESGFVYYLVGFYLLALAVGLPLSLPVVVRRQPGGTQREGWKLHG